MLHFTIIIAISLLPKTHAHVDIIPVVIIDNEKLLPHSPIAGNPFTKLDPGSLADLVHAAIRESEIVLLFIEEQLSVEDITLRDQKGTPFKHLQQLIREEKLIYYPTVYKPYPLLKQFFTQQFNIIFYTGAEKELNFDKRYKHFYIFFEDVANETRGETLRKHDAYIRDILIFARQHFRKIIAVYTGKDNPIFATVKELKFRAFEPEPPAREAIVTILTDHAQFKFKEVFASIMKKRAALTQVPVVSSEKRVGNKLTTTMEYTDFDIKFEFDFGRDDWVLEQVALYEGGEEVGRTDLRVGAPWGYAFRCGIPLEIVNQRDGSLVTISFYEIQPRTPSVLRQEEGEDAGGEGGEGGEEGGAEGGDEEGAEKEPEPPACLGVVECGKLFTAPILSGLFVVAIMLAIASVGITCLMNTHTNDIYDDPHGKALVLSAQVG